MKRGLIWVLLLLTLVWLGFSIQSAQALAPGAQGQTAQDDESIVNGALLYDNWYAALGTSAPAGNMPLWVEQTTNTRSGPETWRCVTCHGWDYQGRDGAYRYGSNFTGFPGVFHARESQPADIVAALQGGNNPQHDFSPYLTADQMNDLAVFITAALIDDNEIIDPQTLAVRDGDAAHGEQLYNQSCAECHGEDGQALEFRFEGRQAWLGTLARLDPWRFLHKTRFGTPGTAMPIGYELGWTPQDGRDVLLYARSLPSGLEIREVEPSMQGREDQPGPQPGGPGTNIFTGILTALGAIATGLGFAVLIGGVLVGVILLIVWLLRGQNK
jgi:mono/diheme cytochrome c family protein